MSARRSASCILSFVAVLAALSNTAPGQSRRQVGLSAVGSGSSLRESPVREFHAYSFGVGNLSKPSPAAGGGVLGSSMYGGGSMTVRRSGAGGGQTVLGTGLAQRQPKSRRVYSSSSTLSIPTVTGRPGGGMSLYVPWKVKVANQIEALVADLAKQRKVILADPDRVITSLVPDVPGDYRFGMMSGEAAFRSEKYAEAEDAFKKAASVSQDSPGSQLALMHTAFAMASGSYSKASGYLQVVLKRVPELALVNVHPKSFYRKSENYDRDLGKLVAHVKANPKDSDALFVLGYMRWRDDKIANAAAALSSALTNASSEKLKERIHILLDGMAASGRLAQPEMPKIKMNQPVDYSTAGIQFALPLGFELRTLRESAQIVRAAHDEGTQEAQSFSAQAFPVAKGITPKAFLEFVLSLAQEKLTMRDLEIVREGDVSFLGIDGFVRMVTYSHRGTDSAAAGVCFIRELPLTSKAPTTEPLRIAYLLVVEGTKAQLEAVGPTLGKVLETVSYTDLRRPIDMPIDITDTAIEDPRSGYAIRPPTGWAAQLNETGLIMGKVDFSLGGLASPEAKVVTLLVPDTWTPKSFGEDAIKRKTEEEGYEMNVLVQGPVKLAGRDGYQFVIRKTPKVLPEQAKPKQAGLVASQPVESSYIEIARLILTPAKDGEKQLYAIVVDSHNCEVIQAQAVMNAIASGFTLLESSQTSGT